MLNTCSKIEGLVSLRSFPCRESRHQALTREVRCLSRCTALRCLGLGAAPVTGLEALSTLSSLTTLHVSLEEKDCVWLHELPALRFLHLAVKWDVSLGRDQDRLWSLPAGLHTISCPGGEESCLPHSPELRVLCMQCPQGAVPQEIFDKVMQRLTQSHPCSHAVRGTQH